MIQVIDEVLKDKLFEKLVETGVPEHMHGAIVRYVIDHVYPGDFLEAVLENNLKEAFGRADDINRQKMYEYVYFLYNFVPKACWGSPQAYRNWLRK